LKPREGNIFFILFFYDGGQKIQSLFITKFRIFFISLVFYKDREVSFFSGLQRHWQTEQAKLDLEKAKLEKEGTALL
jgi:hypothetical protein